MHLSECKQGIYKIVDITSNECMKNHLSNMGIYIGNKITLLRNTNRYPILIKVMGTTLTIGRGRAYHIIVE